MPGFTAQYPAPENRGKTELKSGLRVTFVGLFVNLILAVIKVSVGVLAQSQALIADGVHTISDLLTDIVTIVGLKWGRSPTDTGHPFGHGRIETFFSLIIGVVLTGTGLYILVAAIISGISGVRTVPSIYAAGVAFLSIVTKEWLYRYTIVIGKRIQSPVIHGNAWHHRSDALSSIAVVIGAGAGHLHKSLAFLDPVAAAVVAIMIAYVGASICWDAAKEITDTAPNDEIISVIRSCARESQGVKDVHDIKARTSAGKIQMEIHIEVDPKITVAGGHSIAKSVEECLLREIKQIEAVIVHVDPHKPDGKEAPPYPPEPSRRS
ncbi:MAG: cation transporter [Deltaproteobacteria bacterium]|nr:cation transporter [Deltaproteobacteria bacterium]